MPYLGQSPSKGDENNFKILDDVSSYTLTFDGSSASVVSAANDTITTLNHRFITGQRVTYNKGGGTVITGLSDGVYYIIKEDHHTIKLATSASNAISGTAVNITNVGAGASHTLNVAFDGVNTKFKATHNNGTKANITRSAQLVISINGVIQQPHDSTAPSTGFGFDLDGTIVLSQAPAASDVFWSHVLTNNNVTFDVSDNTIDNFTGNGSTTTFNLSKTPANNDNVLVTIDGVVQYPDDNSNTRAYTVVENVLTFTSAPASGTEIQVRHIGFAGSTSAPLTGFYGRTGNAVLKSTDNVTVNDAAITGNATISGNLTVDGTTTTLDTTLMDVDRIEVLDNSTNVAVAITQQGNAQGLLVHADTNYKGILVNGNNAPTVGFNIGNNATPSWKLGLSGVSHTNFAISQGAGNSDVLRINTSGEARLFGDLITGTVTIGTALIHDADTDTKLLFGTNTIDLQTGGSTRLRIDSNGRIGLGIANPDAYFSSYNRVVMGRTNDTGGMTIVSSTTSGGYISFADGTSGNQAYRGMIAYQHSGDYMTFGTDGGFERLRITSNGKIGINTTNATNLLTVSALAANTAIASFKGLNQVANFDIATDGSSNGIAYVRANTGAIRVQLNSNGDSYFTGGDVGIGTDNPSAKLDVDGQTNLDDVSIAGVTTIADDKKLYLGNDQDLELYYQTSGVAGAYVQSGSASGNLTIRNTDAGQYVYIHGDNVHLRSTTGNEAFLQAQHNGAVSLYYDSSTYSTPKFTTTATGVTIDGTAVAGGLDISGDIKLGTVQGTNTNADLPVLYQHNDNVIHGGSSITWNPAQDVLKVNGNHISSQTFRGDGNLGTLTCDNYSSSTSVNVSNTIDILTVDNAADAFTLKQGSNEYITVDTTNSSELITLGNTTTNPKTIILGGNVGIGTDDPQKKLEVYDGDIYLNSTDKKIFLTSDYDQYITANAASNYLVLGAANKERLRIASDGKIKFAENNSTTDYFEWGSNPRLYLKVPSGTNGLRIDSDTTPLEIRNSSANGRSLSFGSGGATNFDMVLSGDYSLSSSGYDSTPKIFFNATRHNGTTTATSFQCSIQAVATSNTNNTGYLGLGGSASPDDLVILTSGNVGIGTDDPQEILHIHKSGTGPTDVRISNNEGYGFIRCDSNLLAYNAQLHLFANRDRSEEYMRITNDGNVLVGGHNSPLSTYNSTQPRLSIYKSSGSGGYLELGGNIPHNGHSSGTILFINNDNSEATSNNANGKILAMQRAENVTSDTNAGDDCGGDLMFSTKPEAGSLSEKLRIQAEGGLKLSNTAGGSLFEYGGSTVQSTAAININRYGNGYADIRLSSNYGAAIKFAGAGNNTDEYSIQQDNQKNAYHNLEYDGFIQFVTNNNELACRMQDGKVSINKNVETLTGNGVSAPLQVNNYGAYSGILIGGGYNRATLGIGGVYDLVLTSNAYPANATSGGIKFRCGTSGGGGPHQRARIHQDGMFEVNQETYAKTYFFSSGRDGVYSTLVVQFDANNYHSFVIDINVVGYANKWGSARYLGYCNGGLYSADQGPIDTTSSNNITMAHTHVTGNTHKVTCGLDSCSHPVCEFKITIGGVSSYIDTGDISFSWS